jgi:hypothetical protein
MRLRLIVTLAMVFFAGACSIFHKDNGRVVLLNKGSRKISSGTIQVCGQKIIFEGLKPGDLKTFNFTITTDSHYSVAVQFVSGKNLSKNVGYLTSGTIVNDLLIVSDDDVVCNTNQTVKR